MLKVFPAIIVMPAADKLTCEIKATAFVVRSNDVADARANAIEVQIVDIEAFLKRSRRFEEAVLFAGILKSLFRIATKSKLVAKRAPAPASSPRMYDDCNVRARLIILTN